MSTRAAPARAQYGGWYHDPRGLSGTYRWWDGTAWSDWLSVDPAAPPPGRARRSVQPDPLLTSRNQRRLLVGLAAVAVIALVLGILTATGVQTIRARPPVDPAPPPGAPRNLAPEISSNFSEVAVRGVWGAELPSMPFTTRSRAGPEPAPGRFRAAATAIAGGQGTDNWAGICQAGLVDAGVAGSTSDELAVAMLERMKSERNGPKAEPGELLVGPGRRTGSVLAEQRVVERQPDLGRLIVVYVVQAEVWPDGTRVAWSAMTVFVDEAEFSTDVVNMSRALDESLNSTR